jgi:hypothetical protein
MLATHLVPCWIGLLHIGKELCFSSKFSYLLHGGAHWLYVVITVKCGCKWIQVLGEKEHKLLG